MTQQTLVRLGVFTPSVLLGVAAATGRVRHAGLALEEVPVTSSAQQFDDLLSGRLDAVFTSPDNVLAYRGTDTNPLRRRADVRILAAVDRGLGLSLFCAPGVDDGQLRGGVLAVDVPSSGFAFAAYELLARRGLRARVDYTVQALGSTPRRATALAAGGCTMTVLNAGNDLRAEASGCRRLERASSLGPYLGTVLAAPGAAAEAAATPLRRLAELVVTTGDALIAGAWHDVAAAVATQRLGLVGESATAYVMTLVDRAEGLVRGGRVDAASLQTLAWLRARYGAPGSSVDDLIAPESELVDDRFLPPPP